MPDDDGIEPQDDAPPAPALDPPAMRAHALGLHLRTGWVFRHLSFTADVGESVEVVGSGGSGRSMLLLALVGRARHTAGELEVLGTAVPTHRAGAAVARQLRRRTAVAQVGPLVELEGQQAVHQAVAERHRWDRLRRHEEQAVLTYDEAAALVGLTVTPTMRVDELAALDRTLLAVALALTAPHEVLVVDDVDLGLGETEHLRVGQALVDVAATGVVVVSAAARPSRADARVVVMPPHEAIHAQAQEVR